MYKLITLKIMTLVEKESKKELATLMSYKPKNVNLEIFELQIRFWSINFEISPFSSFKATHILRCCDTIDG